MDKEFIKTHFRILVLIRRNLIEFIHVNWYKTIYINFRFFPFKIAIIFPVIVYGRLILKTNRNAKIILNVSPKKGLLKIGWQFELFRFDLYGTSQFILNGELHINGEIWAGQAIGIYIASNAILEMGYNTTIGSLSFISCFKKITLGKYFQIGAKTSITDSNNHYSRDNTTGQISRLEKEVFMGNYNFIGANSIILPGTRTLDRIIIGKGSLCNKDYSKTVAENSLIAGVPAKLVKSNIVRIFDWNKEAKIHKYFREFNSDVFIDTDYSI